ncbi:hypothetical protein HDU93_006232, partial [Gonapodya sp. JEL0774]
MTAPPAWKEEEFGEEDDTKSVVASASVSPADRARPLLLDLPGVHIPARRLRAATEASTRSTTDIGARVWSTSSVGTTGSTSPVLVTGNDMKTEHRRSKGEAAILVSGAQGIKVDARAAERMCYAPHWYDGLTLMSKHWRGWFTVDYLNYVRGKYSLLGAVRIGERATRKAFVEAMDTLWSEGLTMLGPHPTVVGEF